MPKGRNSGTRAMAAGAAALAASVLTAGGASADVTSVSDLSGLSIEQLGSLEITSVSKTSQPLSDAAAAVYVITHEDIVRSGATSLAEILRLAPNLQVAVINANSYAITARGFNGNAADKLLVLIDGRSIYTPLFGGVLWDEKDVLPENIERIEVISGPGATLWGANAVNGVINIITRKAADTQGGLLDLGYGNREARASLQYGGTINDVLAYRTYLEAFSIPHSKTSTGANAEDGWSKGQGGFRLDWTPQNDKITFEGDLYDGREDATATLDTHISGGNFQVNWQHALEDGSQLQLLAYYDGTRRFAGTAGGYSLNTYDIELQHSFMLGESNSIVWGADKLSSLSGRIPPSPAMSDTCRRRAFGKSRRYFRAGYHRTGPHARSDRGIEAGRRSLCRHQADAEYPPLLEAFGQRAAVGSRVACGARADAVRRGPSGHDRSWDSDPARQPGFPRRRHCGPMKPERACSFPMPRLSLSRPITTSMTICALSKSFNPPCCQSSGPGAI